jgi:hypothetical protein
VDIASETSKEQDGLILYCIKKYIAANENCGA